MPSVNPCKHCPNDQPTTALHCALTKKASKSAKSVPYKYNQVIGGILGRLKHTIERIEKMDRELGNNLDPDDSDLCHISTRLDVVKFALRELNGINDGTQAIESDINFISESLLINKMLSEMVE